MMKKHRTQEPVVRMVGITKRFPGVLANDHIDLELYDGEVLALLGENGAGKSTLMNILCGLYRPDEGAIYLNGELANIQSPREAYDRGVGMVHQEFKLVETMTVAENVVLGLEELQLQPNLEQVSRRIREIGKRYGLEVDPEAYIWQLSVGEQQRVEILKLLYRDADVLILDEPTAVLTPQEVDDLVYVLRRVVKGTAESYGSDRDAEVSVSARSARSPDPVQGAESPAAAQSADSQSKAAIFITHKLKEVMMFSDRVTVLRDGEVVATLPTSETNPDELARLMVGREVLFRLEKKVCQPGEPVLEVEDLRARDDKGLPALQGVSLAVRAGEILGIAGVAGNGQRELAEVITGLRPATSGEVRINDNCLTNCSPLKVIRAGVSHIPEDRAEMGLVGDMSVAENLALKGYRTSRLSRGPILFPQAMQGFAHELIGKFAIDTPNPETQVKFLSGGNLQRTILARELTACEGLLVAVHPTRGLDVGATEAVRNLLLEERDKGTAILLISGDLDELLAVSDRIAVIFEGEIMGTVPADDADVETIGLMMAGEKPQEEGVAT